MTDEAQVKKDWEKYLCEKKYEKCELPKVVRDQKKLWPEKCIPSMTYARNCGFRGFFGLRN